MSALVQEQVDITEGSWRCKVLLEIVDPSLSERPEFQAFAEVYSRTRHLKTHSARKQLTPRERMQEDKERLAVEDEMRPGAGEPRPGSEQRKMDALAIRSIG